DWFRLDEFGIVSGWTQTVGNLGALVAAFPLAVAVESIGWRATFVAIGAVTLAMALVALAVVRDRPEALGLPAVNPRREARRAPSVAETVRGVPAVVANPRTWPPVLAAAGVYATFISFQGLWAIPYLRQVYGLDRIEAASAVALLAVGLGLGSPLIGWLCDRWLRLRRLPMVVFTAVYAACWLALTLPAELRLPPAILAPFFLLMGFAASGLVLVWACVREVNDPERVGITVGFCNVPIFLAFAVMQWLTGVMLDAGWTGLVSEGARLYPPSAYRAAFAVCLGVAAGALLAAALVTETRCRSVWQPAADLTRAG
ncbi:MAG TPA: MFS transporter, partial [Methylomirabilota bacterium]|nr:MFS transporter [Methylomirabilota bacterium]